LTGKAVELTPSLVAQSKPTMKSTRCERRLNTGAEGGRKRGVDDKLPHFQRLSTGAERSRFGLPESLRCCRRDGRDGRFS
jgi:macrodomain Ter protein organizer (MatP/YcbG family)